MGLPPGPVRWLGRPCIPPVARRSPWVPEEYPLAGTPRATPCGYAQNVISRRFATEMRAERAPPSSRVRAPGAHDDGGTHGDREQADRSADQRVSGEAPWLPRHPARGRPATAQRDVL